MVKSPILHVDMDAFFAAVEQRDHPYLRGKPVIVGGDPTSRGVVAAASYEARSFGIHSAMPLQQAKRLCQGAFFLKGDHHKYNQVSSLLMEILLSFTPLVEKVSIDEAFLDVRGCERIFGSSLAIAKGIRETIKEELQLTASVGVAPNKLLAKIASDLEKPDGLVLVEPHRVKEFLSYLSIDRLFGVGKKTRERLYGLGIRTIGDLQVKDPLLLELHLGKLGRELYSRSQGLDERPVIAKTLKEKSIGHEMTFPEDLTEGEALLGALQDLSARVSRRLRKGHLKGRTLTLKVRFSNFKTITRNHTFDEPTSSQSLIYQQATLLLKGIIVQNPSYRLLGISISNLLDLSFEQLSLFLGKKEKKEDDLEATIDALKDRFGEGIIKKGGTLFLKE